MEDVARLILGSEDLTKTFGHWPSFHDAEVLDLRFWRGKIEPEKGIYDFPVLSLKIHLWELTREVNSAGFLVTRHHTLTTLKFYDVDDFEMRGFNHQNAMMQLVIKSEERSQKPSPYFAVEVEPAFGMSATFKCLRIEVTDVVPCSEDGDPIQAEAS